MYTHSRTTRLRSVFFVFVAHQGTTNAYLCFGRSSWFVLFAASRRALLCFFSFFLLKKKLCVCFLLPFLSWVIKIIDSMLEHKQKPTEAAFSVGIKAAGQLGKPDFARMLLAERCKTKFRPKEELYVTVSEESCVETRLH